MALKQTHNKICLTAIIGELTPKLQQDILMTASHGLDLFVFLLGNIKRSFSES
jgi:hypothetical protein